MRGLWACAAASAVIAALFSATAAAESPNAHGARILSPEAMLAAASNAAKTTNFEGVLLYRSGPAMEVLRVIHRYKNGQESEHLLTLTGASRELIRQGDHLTCILPSNHRLTLQRPTMKNFLTRLDGQAIAHLKRWYSFKHLGAARIAGQDCTGVAVRPQDDYRYGYEVWLDNTNRLPLRVVLRGDKQQVLEQVMFTEISFPKTIPDKAFAPRMKAGSGMKMLTRKLPDDKSGVVTSPPIGSDASWHFGKLPPGFHVTLRDQREMPDGVGLVDHMLISDGLSSVSVFAARAHPSEPSFNGLSHMGSVHAYGRSLGRYHITVVGEAPARTVRMIGNAMLLPGNADGPATRVLPKLHDPAAMDAAAATAGH